MRATGPAPEARTALTEFADDRPGLRDTLSRARGRGYLLISELLHHHRPVDDGPTWIQELVDAVEEGVGIEVVDDTASGTEPTAIADHLTATTDPVRHYLNGIGRTDLLTAEEEVDLAKRDRAGQAARAVLAARPPGLTPRQGAVLRQVDRAGRRAHEHMIRANLRLVVSIARRYRGRGLDLLDLVQEGNLGLIRAVEKFDHTRGYKFSTYATWWIRQALTRGLADKSRVMRLPVHVHETLGKIRWAELDLSQRLGREPTELELTEALDLTVERLREIRTAARDMLSLDLPIGEDGDATLGHLVTDEDAIDPEGSAAFAMTQELLHAVLGTLSDRERGVVMLRFGLVDGECRTLEEVGVRYGVTRERIRQIEAKTLMKLRHPARADRLEGLVETAADGAASGIV